MPQRRVTDKTKGETTWCYIKHLAAMYISKDNSVFVSLIVLSTYLIWFTIGLLFGDFFSDTALYSFNLTDLSRTIALVTVFTVGSVVVYNSIFKHHPIIILGIVSLMGANLAFALHAFPTPVINTLFDFTSIILSIILYCVSREDCHPKFFNIHKDK